MNTNPAEMQVINVPDGSIRDYVDGKFRKDTPEEYVRQTIEKRLINEHKYKPEQIKIEFGLKLGSRRPRADIVVFPKDSPEMTQDQVWLIVECKNEKVEHQNRKNGVDQLKSYMSACPNCEWGMWTNGKYKEVLRKVKVEGKYEFREFNDIPAADGSLEDIDRPKRNTLKKAYEDNLLMVFKTCHNHIYATDGLQKQSAFFELLKLIFCKTLDEQNVGRPLEFYARSGERGNRDGQLTVQKRISKIFGKVKQEFPQIFELIFCKTLDEQNVGRPLEFYARSGERGDGQLTVQKRISKIFGKVKQEFHRFLKPMMKSNYNRAPSHGLSQNFRLIVSLKHMLT